jgi:hypothetical protein
MINVKKFIADHNLDTMEVAAQLFPENNYQKMALKRILDGSALLDSEQVSKLAAMAKVPINQLFSGAWNTGAKADTLVFEAGDYRAELDTTLWITRILHRGSLFHEEVLTKPTIPLKEYLEQISLRIIKQEFE